MRALYTIIISVYGLFLKLSSLFNQKARDWFYGRKNLFSKLEEVFKAHYTEDNPKPVIWIHCASLGEYEQGRPIIENIKKKFPEFSVLLTFFSPSGFNNKSASSEADYVFYLPIDTRKNAKRFVRLASPAIAIFIKYEFWFNYLNELHKHNVPVYTVSAIFRPEQHFFKWYGGWFRKHLRQMKQIFVQDEESAELLSMIDINNVKVSGDTRFDRVTEIMFYATEIPLIESFLKDKKVLVAGSTWPADEDLLKELFKAMQGSLTMIIAPHEVNAGHIKEVKQKFNGNCILYSELENSTLANEQMPDVLIIDSIGLLSRIYKYADMAYIGGGFGVGIHNTLEAAVYGIPVLFGPNYIRFKEARELIKQEGAISIKTADELITVVNSFLTNPEKLYNYSEASGNYVIERRGATRIIMDELESHISEVISRQY